jgi:hypothetical protein
MPGRPSKTVDTCSEYKKRYHALVQQEQAEREPINRTLQNCQDDCSKQYPTDEGEFKKCFQPCQQKAEEDQARVTAKFNPLYQALEDEARASLAKVSHRILCDRKLEAETIADRTGIWANAPVQSFGTFDD